MQFGPKSGASAAGSSDSASASSVSLSTATEELDTIDYGDGGDVNPDDIPF